MEGFADPWEHIRLLSDPTRNRAMLALLERHARGRTVLEIGCGTGVLSCVAARLGAERVIAVEPTIQVEAARALVEANGLSDIVEVHHAAIEELEPQPVDLVFSELLNAEPFAEGVLEVSRAGSQWVAEGGLLAPRRLEVWVALVRDSGSADELRAARRELDAIEKAHGLDLGSVRASLDQAGGYAYVSQRSSLASHPALLYSTDLLDPADPTEVEIEVQVDEPGPVGGVAIWFRAELDDGIVLENPPGASSHWGLQICAWPELVGARKGAFRLRAEPDGSGFDVVPA